MKYTFSEFQEYFASRRGFTSFASMKTHEQTRANIMINQVLEEIWYAKQYGFNGARLQLAFVPPVTNTVTGTAGEHEITFGTAVNEAYSGIKTSGQYVLINSRLYRILRRRSSTVFSLDSSLVDTVAAAVCTIYFLDYTMPPWMGGVRSIKRDTDDVAFVNEYVTDIDNSVGEADFAHLAGQTLEAYKSNGTVTMTLDSQEVLHSASAEVLNNHVGKAFLLKKAGAFQYYKIIDVDTASNKWIIDKPYTGATEASLTYEIDPIGLQLIRFKSYPTSRSLVEIKYTIAVQKLINANDRTLLPSDIPMMAGIEVAASQIEAVGEGNVNEILFKDKKFKKSLNALNFRGTSMQNRLYSMQEITRIRRFPHNTNPWNTGR